MSKFIENFLKQLDEQEINYLHWKSNTNIEKALVGEDDLDILVDPKDKGKIYQLFKGLNILRGYSEKDSWQNEIFHFFGLDVDAQKMIQIHLHFLLEVGYDFDKSVNLPIVQSYLESKNRYQDRVYIPSVENEYILLIIRLMLKNALLPFLLHFPKKQYAIYKRAHSKGVVVGSAYREYLDLRSRSDREALDKKLGEIIDLLSKKYPDKDYYDKGKIYVMSLYSIALYLQVERMINNNLKMDYCLKKSGEIQIQGFSKRNFNGVRDFLNKLAGNYKKTVGTPSVVTKASGELIITLNINQQEADNLKNMIDNAGVSSFYLGKKGLAYVKDIITEEEE